MPKLYSFTSRLLILSAIFIITIFKCYSQTTCPENISVCFESASFKLTGASPEGGIYSGSGVADGFFDPNKVSSGAHLITYSYTNENNAVSTCTFTITVLPEILESCPLSIGFVCVEMNSYKLWGCSTTPETTATFSGDWVQDGKFYPSLAGIGDHSYTITYTDAAGCSVVSGGMARVIAGAPPVIECPADISVPSISVLPFEITGGSSVPITSTPSYNISDYYTGSGMIDSKIFSPAKAGNGSHLLTYTVEKFHYLSDICFRQCNFNVNVGTLPVTLIHFEAKSKENEIGLSWETSKETNFDYFELQKSVNAKDGFTKIYKSEGSSTNGKYIYTDKMADKGIPWYYRLKMVDKDGSFTFSKMVWALIKGAENLKVYPNPASKQLNIESSSDLIALKLINFSGVEVLYKQVEKVKSKNLILPPLPPGIYLLEAKNTNGVSSFSRILIE